MPTPQNYEDLKFKVITANSNLINEQFQQIMQLVSSINYSIADLVRVAMNQIDFANQVIETGESIVRATVEGNVEINPEEAPDILDGGLWSLISLVVYAEFANEPTGQNILNTNFTAAVAQYKLLVSENNERFVRSINNQPEEEILELPEEENLELLPEEEPEQQQELDIFGDFAQTQNLTKEQIKKYQVMEKIDGSIQLIQYIFETKNKKEILDYMFETVDPSFAEIKSQIPSFFMANSFSISDRLNSFLIDNVKLKDSDNFLETMAVFNIIYNYVQKKNLSKGYVRIGKNKVIDIESSVFEKRYISNIAISMFKTFVNLAVIFKSENRINDFIEKSNLIINRQEINNIYEEYINSMLEFFARTYFIYDIDLMILPIAEVRKQIEKAFGSFPKLYKAISDKIENFYKIQLYEEKESYLKEVINSSTTLFIFKGW
jgi:hypothetical protein